MVDAALTIPFTADQAATSTTERRFVHLEQIKRFESQKTVTMFDVQQMVARARSGKSARTYKPDDCPAYIRSNSLVTEFNFYVWPSSVDLPHTVFSSIGSVSAPEIIEKTVQFSATFKLTDVIEFDFVLTDIVSAVWETDCYDAEGQKIDVGEPYMDGLSTMRISKPAFGVVRITGIKKGAQHSVNVRLVKHVPAQSNGDLPTEEEFNESAASAHYTYQEWLSRFYGYTDVVSWNSRQGIETVPQEPVNMTGLSITNLQATVTAKWMGVDGEEKTKSLRMEIPQCLRDLLAACGVDTDGDGIPDYFGPGTGEEIFDICGDGDEPVTNVYVSACTVKKLLAVAQDDDESSWCGHD